MFSSLCKKATRFVLPAIVAGSALIAFAPAANAGATTYLAIGDSYAFGYKSFVSTPPVEVGGGSNGDQGYVSLFADYLATIEGVRPTVFNTARPGETTTSYFGNTTPTPPVNFNTNYAPFAFNKSQASLVTDTLAGATDPIKYVTVQLGGNDLIDIASDFVITPTEANTFVTNLTTNLTPLLGGLHATLPNAKIILLGYPNAFNGLLGTGIVPDASLLAFDAFAKTVGNGTLQNIAALTGVTFVDPYAAFAGQEATLTNILTNDITGNPNYHPNDAGYTVLANQLINAAPVPETNTGMLVALGGMLLGAAVVVRRRARTA